MRSVSRRRWATAMVLAASGWLVLGVTITAAPPVLRSLAVFGFVFICPGLAVVRLLPLRDHLERAVLAVAIGLSLASLAAEGMAASHLLHPVLVLVSLAALCTAASAAELVRS